MGQQLSLLSSTNLNRLFAKLSKTNNIHTPFCIRFWEYLARQIEQFETYLSEQPKTQQSNKTTKKTLGKDQNDPIRRMKSNVDISTLDKGKEKEKEKEKGAGLDDDDDEEEEEEKKGVKNEEKEGNSLSERLELVRIMKKMNSQEMVLKSVHSRLLLCDPHKMLPVLQFLRERFILFKDAPIVNVLP